MRNNCCGLQQSLGMTEFQCIQRNPDGKYTAVQVDPIVFKWRKELFTVQLPPDLKPQAEEV